MDDDIEKPMLPGPRAGDDLSDLSVDELARRIGIFEEEITRLKAEIAAKESSKAAADSVFKL